LEEGEGRREKGGERREERGERREMGVVHFRISTLPHLLIFFLHEGVQLFLRII
jgi:hypothetical protein